MKAMRRSMVSCWATALVLSVLVYPHTANGQCTNYGDYLHWAGSVEADSARDVAVSGNYAYVQPVPHTARSRIHLSR